jgi:CRP-like cAMP-binding protein
VLSTGIYLLRRGTVRAYLATSAGREIVNRVLGSGAILGFPAAMCSRSFQFTVEALEATNLAFLETRALNEYLRARPDLCMQVVTMMSDELIELHQKRDHMKSCDNTECSLHASCKCAH